MKVNKKKIVVLCGVIVLFIGIVIIVRMLIHNNSDSNSNNDDNADTDKMFIEQLFDIKNDQYEILEIENGLDEKEYGGSYRAVLRVTEDNIQDFKDEVEDHYFQPDEEEGYGSFTDELGEDDLFYTNLSSVKRNIPSAKWIPKTCNFFIYILSNEDGSYNVDMKYTE